MTGQRQTDITPAQSAEYVRVWTASDEWYPYVFIVKAEERHREAEVLLTEEELAFVKQADADFRKAQELLRIGEERAQSDGGES